jgi:hypothetical protein
MFDILYLKMLYIYRGYKTLWAMLKDDTTKEKQLKTKTNGNYKNKRFF